MDDADAGLTPLSEALGDLLSSFRDGAGLTQKQLGDRIGYARVTVATAECGQRIPSAAFWDRCDTVLGAGGALRGAYGQLATARRTRASQRLQDDQARRDAQLAEATRRDPSPTGSEGVGDPPPSAVLRGSAAALRRAGTPTGSAAAPFPVASIDDLRHIAAALKDSRYVDRALIGVLRDRVAAYAADDGAIGPKRTLPQVLAVLAVIEDTLGMFLSPSGTNCWVSGRGWLSSLVGCIGTSTHRR